MATPKDIERKIVDDIRALTPGKDERFRVLYGYGFLLGFLVRLCWEDTAIWYKWRRKVEQIKTRNRG